MNIEFEKHVANFYFQPLRKKILIKLDVEASTMV